MHFLRNHWYQFGLLFFIGLNFFLLLSEYRQMTTLQVLLCASLMTLPLHQYEEYALPGGGPVVINRIFYGEKNLYDRYPGNWNSIMIVNLSAYVVYILALLFPKVIWLGTATMFFNLFQVLGHGIEMNIKMRTWYNPGMASAVLLMLPISCAYLYQIVTLQLISELIWLLSCVTFIAILLLTVVLPVQLCKDKQSKYIIPQWQIEQFKKVRQFAAIHKENCEEESI